MTRMPLILVEVVVIKVVVVEVKVEVVELKVVKSMTRRSVSNVVMTIRMLANVPA